jgi:glucose/arabinose dehydrogenase
MTRGCAPPTCQRFRNALRLALLLVSTLPSAADGIQWPQVSLAPAITGVSQPTHITHAGDGSGRLFVVEQRGNIRIVKNGVLQSAPFLDISSRLSCCGERGLLSVAFPPAYADRGYFFVYYTNTSGDIVVARYSVTTNPDVADPNSEALVLKVPHPTFGNHNGGQLAFGPDDGDLYIGTGDGGSGGDPPNNAQNTNVLLGKLLRIDVLSGSGASYAIPASNPYAQVSGYRPEIWAFGVRNPWRFSFDRLTHDLYIADVGQGSYEEIDYQPAGNPGGQNYGWRIMEGLHCYNATTCNMSGLTLPVAEYSHAQGDCSVTGGFVYRGQQFARMQGIYFYGDYCTGRIWGLQRDGGAWVNMPLYDAPFNITTFGEDEAGNVYVANATNGAIAMLTDAAAPTATVTRTTATPTPTRSAGTLSIGGQIVYAGSGLPVSGATVQLFGPAPGAVQTNAAGQFTFTGLSPDAWSIQPRKFEPKSNALNAADAVAILQAAVGIRSLDAVQLLACDVNGDGRPTASDAVLVLMYNVEIISSFPTAQRCGSDWIFVPQPQGTANQRITPASLAAGACQPGSIAWTPLADPVTNQNFVAVLIGDCSGNWQPGTP